MDTYYLVCFDRKSGKIDICLEAQGKALLKLWALQNTTRTKDSILFEKSSGAVDTYYTGAKDFPKIEEHAGNIEDYCPGFLEAIRKDEAQSKKGEPVLKEQKTSLNEQLEKAKEEKPKDSKIISKGKDQNLYL